MKLDEVNVRLLLSRLKSFHAGWVVDFYNKMTRDNCKDTIASGWRAAGISNAINLGSRVVKWSNCSFCE